MTRSTAVVGAAVAALTAAGCSSEAVVNTGEPWVPQSPASAPPPAGPPNSFALVDASEYFAQSAGQAGYYFATPSGKWRCAILPHTKAGCQSARGSQSAMGIPGEPGTVVNAAGATTAPNALVVEAEGDAHFAALDTAEFWLVPGPANALPFNKILAAAGFRCNVQQAGVSCLSEGTGKGFTFSADGYTLQYTDVAAGPPG